jgi:ribose/xylose/arabinose/galactoside ABC-type transport system permease subunit
MNKEQLLKIGKKAFGGGKNGIFFVLIILFIVCSIFVDGFFFPVNLTNVFDRLRLLRFWL